MMNEVNGIVREKNISYIATYRRADKFKADSNGFVGDNECG